MARNRRIAILMACCMQPRKVITDEVSSDSNAAGCETGVSLAQQAKVVRADLEELPA